MLGKRKFEATSQALFSYIFVFYFIDSVLYANFFFQSIINKMRSCYLRCGICTRKSMQRETAFSSVIGFLAPNSYSCKISKCRMISIISVGSDRWRVRLSPCLQEESGTLKAKRGLKFSNKFPKVSSLVSMNTLTTLPWKLKIFSVHFKRKDVAQLNEGRGELEANKNDFKETVTKGTLVSNNFLKIFTFETKSNV